MSENSEQYDFYVAPSTKNYQIISEADRYNPEPKSIVHIDGKDKEYHIALKHGENKNNLPEDAQFIGTSALENTKLLNDTSSLKNLEQWRHQREVQPQKPQEVSETVRITFG